MSTSKDYILRERVPVKSLIPALDGPLELSDKQIDFLLHAIHELDPEANDAEAEIRRRVLEIQSKYVVPICITICYECRSSWMAFQSIVCHDNTPCNVCV